MTGDRRAWALAAAIAVAAVVWDPRAPAADPKRAAGLLVAVVALALAVARPPKAARALPRAAGAFAAFAAWSGLALAWGVPSGVRDLAAWVAAAGLAIAIGPAEQARRVAERAALLAGTGAAVVAIAQRLGGARGIFVHGGQGNANWLGLLLAVTLPLSLAAVLAPDRRPRERAAVLGALVIQLAGLALSHSRVAWAASAVALGLIAVSAARRNLPAKRRAPAIAGAAALVLASIAIASRGAPAAVPDTRPSAASIAEGADVPVAMAWSGRVWIWRASADAAVSALPFGAGLGGFGHAYLDAQGKRLAPLEPKVASRRFLNATTAHSDWIEVLVDAGLPALALLALAVAWGVRDATKTGWPGGAASLAAFAICAAGDSPLRQPGVALLLGLILGGTSDPSQKAAPFELPPHLARSARLALLAVSALLLAASAGGYLASRRLTAAREAAPGARRALLASAARLDPRSGEVDLEAGLFELEAGDAEAALPALRRARARLANVGTDVAIGNAEVMLGRHDAALAAYEAALARHPGSFRAHANVTQPLVALGRIDEAQRHLTIASSLWPGHPRLEELSQQIKRARVDRDTGAGTE